jgi:transketolase
MTMRRELANAIRALSMEGVQRANSGHPGMPMGMADNGWRYVGGAGRVLGLDRFGASGKVADVFPHFGFTADNIAQQIRELLED